MRDAIAFAIPFFFLLIGGELLWARARGVRLYRLGDALTNLSCGITSQMAVLFYAGLELAAYSWLYEHLHMITLPSAWAWIVAFVGVDFAYYWWHRASHEVNVLWAAHIVHHQSEDYNLSVALRQSAITNLTSFPFYAPLALLGVPAIPFFVTRAASTLYQFWIHTQLIGKKRGFFDYVFNLPSHHRVHHAINPQYLDKNYGATLIVWDRWFGSYAEEVEAPVYGITKALASFNPWWAQVHYWTELAKMSARTPALRDKLAVWWKPPHWHPPGVSTAADHTGDHAPRAKYEPAPIRERLSVYLLLQYALIVVGATVLIFRAKELSPLSLSFSALVVLVALLAVGGLLEHKRWGPVLEAARLASTVTLLIALFSL